MLVGIFSSMDLTELPVSTKPNINLSFVLHSVHSCLVHWHLIYVLLIQWALNEHFN